MKSLLIASAAALLAPLSAQAQEAQEAPITAPAAIDPLRLEAARAVADKVFPEGTYSRLMEQAMGSATKMAMDSVGKMPLRDLAGIGGMSEDKLAGMGDGTLAEIMAIYDPAYEQRMDRTMKVMGGEFATLFTKFEPAMRDGLQRAYAKRFPVEQLAELNRFFETPAGAAFAEQSLMIWMDPEVMQGMQAAMPEMMKALPAIMEKVTVATADLPKARKFEDLTAAERKKLANLLGISEAELAKRN